MIPESIIVPALIKGASTASNSINEKGDEPGTLLRLN
jgi:hypothetical protein